MAVEKTRLAGADENGIEIVDLEEIAMTYLEGRVVRVKVKAAGPVSPNRVTAKISVD
jgi:hypothetical protein